MADPKDDEKQNMNFDYASFSKLKNQVLIGLFTFGIFLPIAWFICSTMVSNRLGGEVLSQEMKNNPLLQSTFNNLSIQTILQKKSNQYGLNPMIGLVPTNTSSLLWWVSVLTLTFFLLYFSISSNMMIQSHKACSIPSMLDAGGQSGFMFIPIIFPAISFVVNFFTKITDETEFNPRRSNIAATWGQKSLFIMSICLLLIIGANFISLWGTCAMSIWILLFAIVTTLLIGLSLYLWGDMMKVILSKLAFIMGVEVNPDNEDESFFMRYAWIWFGALPAYLIGSTLMPVFMVRNINSICKI
jgi:hypothetical protein